ncbi:hypothetical protein BKA82DRAFT_1007207 [Pisolithus tinctorius]|nr:hypothetical protein BKA82DRAFT_1007207 [Pisolithus tinctorius]
MVGSYNVLENNESRPNVHNIISFCFRVGQTRGVDHLAGCLANTRKQVGAALLYERDFSSVHTPDHF